MDRRDERPDRTPPLMKAAIAAFLAIGVVTIIVVVCLELIAMGYREPQPPTPQPEWTRSHFGPTTPLYIPRPPTKR